VEELETPERCSIMEIANDDGDEMVSIARAKVKPRITTAWHRLKGVTVVELVLAQGIFYRDTSRKPP
jgi:hypothetical protein